tara:strand:+ start:4 stop:339 length:336 start_codon:yes stop_codon:yes gene_type:complete
MSLSDNLISKLQNICLERNIHISQAELKSYSNKELRFLINKYASSYVNTYHHKYKKQHSVNKLGRAYYLYNTSFSKNNTIIGYETHKNPKNIENTYNYCKDRSNSVYWSKY